MVFPVTRMRRYRKNSKIRDIVRETKLDKEDLELLNSVSKYKQV